MPFNIDNFIGNINTRGTLQNNRFEVVFQPPARLFNVLNRDSSELLTYRAESVKLPGLTLSAYDNRRYGVGPIIKTPTNVQFSDVDVTFIETSNKDVFDIFYQWTNLAVNYRDLPEASGIDRQIFTTEYKDNIVSRRVEIRVYNNRGVAGSESLTDSDGPVATVELIDAFPLSVSDTQLSWSDNNSLFKVNVQFAYTSWRMIRAE